MNQHLLHICLVGALFCLQPLAAAGAAEGEDAAAAQGSASEREFFEQQVLPILSAKCFRCHGGGEKLEGALRLTSRAAVLEGGDSGAAVDLESPEDSILLSAINYVDYEMPPTGKLPPEQIDVLTRWVKMGLPYPEGLVKIEPHTARPHAEQDARDFWSFQPVKQAEPPVVKNSAWVKTPIDAFVLRRLEAAGLAPSAPASAAVLVRRVYYDLIGLPPSPAELQYWAERLSAARQADTGVSDAALEALVDHLLATPQYGEKWGRHWLDLVRYAETNSYERDDAKPEVWRYRDYVVRAFNEDKPYDQFVIEQLAGDELEQPTPDGVIATGYYRLGRWDDEPVDAKQAWFDDLDDVLLTTSQVFFGLTMNCARCHDHKIDPISQEDYYRFLAFFSGVQRYGGPNRGRDVQRWSLLDLNTDQWRSAHEQTVAQRQAELEKLEAEIAAIETSVREILSPVEREDFQYESNRLEVLQKHVPADFSQQRYDEYAALRLRRDTLKSHSSGPLGRALCVKETGPDPQPMHVLARGNPAAPGKAVQPGFPRILGVDDPEIPAAAEGAKTSGRRMALARWVIDPANPLTARVFVNRVWQYHFGRGIVRSANDYGLQGTSPTHPELLDWLAADFVAQGWRVKRLHKLMIMSSVYRQSSAGRKDGLEEDPENNLFWRFDMRRLTAEEVRDSILAVNGTLSLQVGGPSIFPPIPKEVLAGQSRPGHGWPVSKPEDCTRRSVYIHVKRSLLVPILENHDMADVDATCPVRFNTTVPSQALGLLNSEFLGEEADRFAAYTREQAGSQAADQVRFILARVTQREPKAAEVERGIRLMDSLQSDHAMSPEDALKYFCLVALNLNEFVYLD